MMSTIIFSISLTLCIVSFLALLHGTENTGVCIVLIIASLFGMMVFTPMQILEEEKKEKQIIHSKHVELMDPTYDYCPYCGVEIE